jgi:phosphatidylglycerol:prolipoprotein diacylglycerol transferase
MFPTLFHIGPVPIHGYGLMLAVGFLTAMYLAQRDSKYFDIPEKKLADLFPWIILAGAGGARLFHVVVERPAFFWEHPLDIFKLWDGGVTFYGGLMGGVLVVYIFSRRNKIPFIKIGDFLITYVALGQVFGRLGCFLAGCCYGVPTDLPWGVAITNPDTFASNPVVSGCGEPYNLHHPLQDVVEEKIPRTDTFVVRPDLSRRAFNSRNIQGRRDPRLHNTGRNNDEPGHKHSNIRPMFNYLYN